MTYNAPSPYVGYSGAQRGASVAQFPSEYKRAEDGEFDGADEDTAQYTSNACMRVKVDKPAFRLHID